MTKKVMLIEKVAMIVLLLSPILWIYGNPDGWSLETLCTLPLSFLYFLGYFFTRGSIIGNRDPLPQGMVGYFIYWTALFVMTSMRLPLSMIQIYLAFFLFFATFDREYFIKIYRFFALICIVFFFLQEVSYMLVGVRISGALSFLPMHGNLSMSEYMLIHAESLRSSSFFAEPSHFAQFLLPLLAIEIFYNKSKTRMVFAIVIGAVLLFLRSGNGLLGMIPILLFLLPYCLRKGSKYGWLVFLTIAFFIIVVSYYYVNSQMGTSMIGRQDEMSMEYKGGSRSGFLRIWRGLYVYGDYSLVEKLFGCPNEAAQLGHVYASDMRMIESAELYFNAFWKVLLNTGVVGLVIFIYLIVRLWRGNNVCGKAILASFIALSLMAAIYMSHTMILFLVLVKSMKTAPEGMFLTFKTKRQLMQ